MVIANCWKRWKDKSQIHEIKQRRHEEWATMVVQKCFRLWQVTFLITGSYRNVNYGAMIERKKHGQASSVVRQFIYVFGEIDFV